jgi:hypothetical protein
LDEEAPRCSYPSVIVAQRAASHLGFIPPGVLLPAIIYISRDSGFVRSHARVGFATWGATTLLAFAYTAASFAVEVPTIPTVLLLLPSSSLSILQAHRALSGRPPMRPRRWNAQ